MSRQFNAVIKPLSQLNEQSEDNAITHQHNICTITNAICQPAGGQAGGTKILLNVGGDDVIAIYIATATVHWSTWCAVSLTNEVAGRKLIIKDVTDEETL